MSEANVWATFAMSMTKAVFVIVSSIFLFQLYTSFACGMKITLDYVSEMSLSSSQFPSLSSEAK